MEDQSYRQLQEYANAKFRWQDGGVCLDCPLYRITATIIGRFDYFQTQTVAVRANVSTAKPFIHAAGDANAPLSRLVLQSVPDVAGVSIDALEDSTPEVATHHPARG